LARQNKKIMRKVFLRLGGLMALLAVALGAFGAHALKEVLAPEQLQSFEIGLRYQFYHALATIIVGLILFFRKTPMLLWAGWLFTIGTMLFSGSLYLLSLQDILQLSSAWLGPITPIGGGLLILGWGAFVISSFQENQMAYRSRGKE
jgi:uncharacterized membrane protein YgdD (TMEM256/DUF423 family)